MDTCNTQPPLGLMPKKIHNQKRFVQVCEAITRYYSAGLPIPVEWVEEYNELVVLLPKEFTSK